MRDKYLMEEKINSETFDFYFKQSEMINDSYLSYIKMISELNNSLLTKEREKELFKRINNGDELARKEVIESNLKLVISIAKKLSSNQIDLIELVAAGNIGLLLAIDKFDLTKGYRFTTYATWWIEREIKTVKLKNKSILEITYGLGSIYSKYYNARDRLSVLLEKEPTSEELAKFLEIPLEDILYLRMCDKNYIPLTGWFETDEEDAEELVISDLIAGEEVDFDKHLFNEIINTKLYEVFAIVNLNEREIQVMELLYGLNGHKKLATKDIAAMIGITRQAIMQLELRVYKKIRENDQAMEVLGEYLYEDKKVRAKRIELAKGLGNKKVKI